MIGWPIAVWELAAAMQQLFLVPPLFGQLWTLL